jgi:RimJ/RimL family protein N-acetyltransferase
MRLARENQTGHLGPLESQNNIIQLGMMIGDKSFWGKGIGSEVVELGLKFAFKILKVHKVVLDVREDNLRAIRVYEKNGFVHEGVVQAQVLKNNRYYDLLRMSAVNPHLKIGN